MPDIQLHSNPIPVMPKKQQTKTKGAGVTGTTGQARAHQAMQAAQAGDHFRHKLVLNAWMIEQFGFNALPQAGNTLPIRELSASIAKISERAWGMMVCIVFTMRSRLPCHYQRK